MGVWWSQREGVGWGKVGRARSNMDQGCKLCMLIEWGRRGEPPFIGYISGGDIRGYAGTA